MRFTKILFTIFIALGFASCQKEISTDNGNTPTSSKIKTYTEDVTSGSGHSVITFNLAYDSNDRLISMVSAASSGDRFEFQYSNGSFTSDLYNSNALSIHEVFFINRNSLLDSTFQYNDTNDSSTEKYLYNSAMQLTTLKEYDYSLVTGPLLFNTENYVYDSNGNVIKMTDNSSVTTYDYYTNLVNNLVLLPDYLPVNKNLVKTTTSNLGGTTTTLNHTYTFDSNNRISTERIIVDSGEIAIKTYTYY
jgi:hypothetical protein